MNPTMEQNRLQFFIGFAGVASRLEGQLYLQTDDGESRYSVSFR
jgi:hypothetical protein